MPNEIRFATSADISGVVELGQEVYSWSAESEVFDFDPESLADFLTKAIFKDEFLLLVAELDGKIVGGILGVFGPKFYNYNHVVLAEMGFFVTPEYRGDIGKQLLDAFEKVGKNKGVRAIEMGAHVKADQAKMERYYKTKGYTLLDAVYMKEV